ncbi:hypothetical protein BDB00DRAFT_772342 [Zychaea mexicana]|uniref:uncharacterized protein n=1 Tax=Zychaea mexicana TaxID=64656 RepID=UPI0022FE71D1|nr:uncharacterized protein BDB00DRAFT_772342 [Zychaea mexicana]KAI9488552.1 hypothetical protein BDB00DRAFT_772342 [Zychaea mexicana]
MLDQIDTAASNAFVDDSDSDDDNDGNKKKEGIHADSEPTTPVPACFSPQQELTKMEKRRIELPADNNMADYVTPPTPGTPPPSDPAYSEQLRRDSSTSPPAPATPTESEGPVIKANTLSPREQEKEDQAMLEGMEAFFNNRFAEAETAFRFKADEDPLYSLGLGSMAFIKALSAIAQLTATYEFANGQIMAASAKKPLKDTVSHYFTNLMGSNNTGLPTNTPPLPSETLKGRPLFIPNGALRAHVVKAECCLLMAMLYLTQETVVGYLKSGLNLRRAYNSYSLVWQEYKRMGQEFNRYMDKDTISAIQFGIGSVHILLSSLPAKILKIVSAFGWKADKHLGFALLKLCMDGQRIRSPLASMMLLSYYVTLMSYCPQVLTRDLLESSIEILLNAQQMFPNSALFLYYAGRISRLSRNIPLSTQSFMYTYQVSQGAAWAEHGMGYLATHETAFNCVIELDWAIAALRTMELQGKHGSPAFNKYFYGACMEMLGNRSEAILAFAEATTLCTTHKKKRTQIEQFVEHRIKFFEKSGYQDMDYVLPGLEICYLWNIFSCMQPPRLEACLEQVETTLGVIYKREKKEYEVRTLELMPDLPPPNYYDQRAILLLIKAHILNCLGQSADAIAHLNWIVDHKGRITYSKWVLPYAYWESGVVSWYMGELKRARALWTSALTYSGYDFEYRLAIQANLAINHATEIGVPETPSPKMTSNQTTNNGRKRLPLANPNPIHAAAAAAQG